MKLIMCPNCKDVFRLRSSLRKCECGLIMGRYLDSRNAEVSKDAINLAIGNGSLLEAIRKMNILFKATKGQADRNAYLAEAKINHVWVRPNSGKGNPNTKILEDKNEIGDKAAK